MGKHRRMRTPAPFVTVPLVVVPVVVAVALGTGEDVPAPASAAQRVSHSADGTVPEAPRLAAGVEMAAPAPVPPGTGAVPAVALRGYVAAQDLVSVTHPGCGLKWPLLAAIGQAQTGHAAATGLDEHGDTIIPSLGPVLDGERGQAAVPDTDGGVWDRDARWDRAVGPMRLLPSVWAEHGRDASGDGVAIPHNTADAALGAARFLCSAGADLTDPRERAEAVYRFHGTAEFVTTVLAWQNAFDPDAPKTTASATPEPPAPKAPAPKPPAPKAPAPQAPAPEAPAPKAPAPKAPTPPTRAPAKAPAPEPTRGQLPGEQWYDWGKWLPGR